MRVLFLIDSLGTGGAERSTLDLCIYLKSRNHSVQIICLRQRQEGVQDEALALGFEVHFLEEQSFISSLLAIDRVIKKFNPDIVHTVLFKSRLRGKLHKIFFFKKYVLVESLVNIPFQETRMREKTLGKVKVLFHRVIESVLGLIAVDQFVAISHEVKERFLKEVFLLNEKRISVVRRGRSGNEFIQQRDTLRSEYAGQIGYPENALVVTHVGRQDFQKNHEFLIQAFQKLLQRSHSPVPLVLLCLGRRGDMSWRIDRLLDEPNLKKNIFLLGHRNDVQQLLAQSDIFVLPSLFEGVGGAIIEAKAAELPIIVSNLRVFKEILEEGEAFLISLNNVDELVEKMELLIADPSVRLSMGKQNLESFKLRFSQEEANREMESLYHTFLSGKDETKAE